MGSSMATMSLPARSITGISPCSWANSAGTRSATASPTRPFERSTNGSLAAFATASVDRRLVRGAEGHEGLFERLRRLPLPGACSTWSWSSSMAPLCSRIPPMSSPVVREAPRRTGASGGKRPSREPGEEEARRVGTWRRAAGCIPHGPPPCYRSPCQRPSAPLRGAPDPTLGRSKLVRSQRPPPGFLTAAPAAASSPAEDAGRSRPASGRRRRSAGRAPGWPGGPSRSGRVRKAPSASSGRPFRRSSMSTALLPLTGLTFAAKLSAHFSSCWPSGTETFTPERSKSSSWAVRRGSHDSLSGANESGARCTAASSRARR